MGRIELSPQTVIGPTSGSGVTFRGRLGKSRRQSDGSREELWPSCVHTQDLSKTNGRTPKTQGLRSGAAESSEDLDGWHFSAGHSLHQGCSPPGAPPAETLNTKPYHGCHAKLPGQPRLRRIIRRHQGLNTTPPRNSDWPVPATTDASVEPHTHHRRLLHAFGLLASSHLGEKWNALSRTGPRVH